jgi:hypothetical protein
MKRNEKRARGVCVSGERERKEGRKKGFRVVSSHCAEEPPLPPPPQKPQKTPLITNPYIAN